MFWFGSQDNIHLNKLKYNLNNLLRESQIVNKQLDICKNKKREEDIINWISKKIKNKGNIFLKPNKENICIKNTNHYNIKYIYIYIYLILIR